MTLRGCGLTIGLCCLPVLASSGLGACRSDTSHPEISTGSSPPADAGALASQADASDARAHHIAVDQVITRLEADGFVVQEGAFAFFDVESCRALPSCFGNNPSSPYGLYYLPKAKGQTVDEESARDDGLSPTFRLREDEALVFIGETPPEVAYYSFRSYVFDRDDGLGGRKPIFASLGDALNHDVIQTIDGARFGSEAVLITSANGDVERRVRDDLVRADVPQVAINFDRIPASLCHMGLDATADTFTMLFRAALFRSSEARAAYLAKPRARVLRVTPARVEPTAPFALPTLRPEAKVPDEASLRGSLDALEKAVRKVEGLSLAVSVPVTYRELDGLRCAAESSNCLGDNHDTTYATAVVGRITAEQTLYVLGVNHAATGKATYANVSVYAIDKLLGVAAVDDRSFAGTATRYLPDDPHAEQLFVWKLARDCAGERACTEVPTGFPGLEPQALAALAFRAYLEPGQHTSPSADTLLVERVLKVGGL